MIRELRTEGPVGEPLIVVKPVNYGFEAQLPNMGDLTEKQRQAIAAGIEFIVDCTLKLMAQKHLVGPYEVFPIIENRELKQDGARIIDKSPFIRVVVTAQGECTSVQ